MLVLGIAMLGLLLALPNIYGSINAVQLAEIDGKRFTADRVERVVEVLESSDITPHAAYLQDGRIVVTFDTVEAQTAAGELLRDRFASDSNVAITLAPNLPAWVRNIGLSPMSLGLDLRGGVYFLLEVDMETAIESRLQTYDERGGIFPGSGWRIGNPTAENQCCAAIKNHDHA